MLAINGGMPFISEAFSKYNPIQETEIAEANAVLQSGVLSDFLGASGMKFLGGSRVQALEKTASLKFGSKYCVSFNSWTSGLTAMVGAIPNLKAGDEVITTPWTMSATATAILQVGAIPVFADIDENDFQMTSENIRKKINSRTRAILSVDIFGRSSDYDMLREICEEFDLLLLSDSAQAPGAKYKGKYITQLSDVGGYSLNYHKHIHSGEGGFALTDDESLAERMQLLRNHAESVVEVESSSEKRLLIGNNFRLGELEAAIARPQIERIDSIVQGRIAAAHKLIGALNDLPHLTLPEIKHDSSNVFYILPIKYSPTIDISRDKLVEILKMEGVPGLVTKYTNIHRLPLFVEAKSMSNKPHPWSTNLHSNSFNSYGEGACPVAEDLFDHRFLGIHMCTSEFRPEELMLVEGAFKKVWRELGWTE